MSRFAERVAVVTGGAQGIGRRVVGQLHAEGASVLILDIDGDLAHAAASEIGPRVIGMGGDVAKRADVAGAVDLCVERFGRIDLMVAHAGIADIEPFMQIGDASWQRMMDVNVNGAFFCTQEAARHMIAAGIRGSIVVTCSTNAFWVESNATHYNASKGAVATFVRSAALDLAPHGIRVNGVDPGLIRTRLTRYVTDIPANAADYLPRIPLSRFGEPQDIAEAILFLGSDQSSWITGQRICVDGGQTLGTPLPLPDEALPGSHRAVDA